MIRLLYLLGLLSRFVYSIVDISWEEHPEEIREFQIYNPNPGTLKIDEVILWEFLYHQDISHMFWYTIPPIPPKQYSKIYLFKLHNTTSPNVVQRWSTIVSHQGYDFYTRVQAQCNFIPQDRNGTTLITMDIAKREFKVQPPASEYCKSFLHYSNVSYLWA